MMRAGLTPRQPCGVAVHQGFGVQANGMVVLFSLLIGGALGWVSYRFQGAFAEVAVVVGGLAAIAAVRLGAWYLLASRAVAASSPEAAARVGAFNGGVADAGLAFGGALVAARLATHVYWRCIHRPAPPPTPEEARARTLAFYGFEDSQSARLSRPAPGASPGAARQGFKSGSRRAMK